MAAKWDAILEGRETVRTAQVLKNWYTLKCSNFATPSSFFTTHEYFAPVDIIRKKNVTLLRVSETEAVFSELDPTMNLLDVRKHPIFFIPQTYQCRRIIRIPSWAFQQAVDKIDITDRRVVWMFNTQRCGSTTWAQIFSALPNWTVLSEPQVFYQSIVNGYSGNDIPLFTETTEFEAMLTGIIKFYVSLAPPGGSVLWKTMPVDEPMLKVVPKLFPEHKLTFTYRNVLTNAGSYHQCYMRWPLVLNYIRHLEIDPFNKNPTGQLRVARLVYNNGFDVELCAKAIEESKLKAVIFEWFVLKWAAKIRAVLDAKAEGIEIKPVKYEFLLKDLRKSVTQLFEYLEVSADLIPKALAAASADSLAGTFISRDAKARNTRWNRTTDGVNRCNKVLEIFGLPDLDTDYVMDGSI